MHRTPFHSTPPHGPQHPPCDAGRVDGISAGVSPWRSFGEAAWGPSGSPVNGCRHVDGACQLHCSSGPTTIPRVKNIGFLMPAAETTHGVKSCSLSLFPGFGAPERYSHGTGHPSIPLLGGSVVQTAEQGMQAAASSCPQPCAGTCLPPAAGAQRPRH